MDATDARILTATWRLLRESPDLKVRMADVAAAAGVSRQAVYLHFGNRSNLLLQAVRFRDADRNLTRPFVDAALRDPLPDALGNFVRALFGYLPHIHPVAQMLSAAAKIDAEASAAWEDRMILLRSLIAPLAKRLADAGHLRAPWTVETATDWIWHRTHIDSWRHLVDDRNWTPQAAADAIAASLERDLLA